MYRTLLTLMLAALGGCAIAPSHPALTGAALPELIPVRDFVANRFRVGRSTNNVRVFFVLSRFRG